MMSKTLIIASVLAVALSACNKKEDAPAPATNPFILVNAAGTDMQRSSAFQFQAIRVGLSLRF